MTGQITFEVWCPLYRIEDGTKKRIYEISIVVIPETKTFVCCLDCAMGFIIDEVNAKLGKCAKQTEYAVIIRQQ